MVAMGAVAESDMNSGYLPVKEYRIRGLGISAKLVCNERFARSVRLGRPLFDKSLWTLHHCGARRSDERSANPTVLGLIPRKETVVLVR